jgi:sulfur-oxidizing protein SoxY
MTRRGLLSKLVAVSALLLFRNPAQGGPDFDIASEPPPVYTLEERLTPILAGRTPTHERVTLIMPPHAEDGGTVPMQLDVESPMTEQSHVQKIYVIADQNPDPLVFSASLHPGIGHVRWKLNIRLAENSRVRAIAEMNNGELFTQEVEVEVLVGGCG